MRNKTDHKVQRPQGASSHSIDSPLAGKEALNLLANREWIPSGLSIGRFCSLFRLPGLRAASAAEAMAGLVRRGGWEGSKGTLLCQLSSLYPRSAGKSQCLSPEMLMALGGLLPDSALEVRSWLHPHNELSLRIPKGLGVKEPAQHYELAT